MSAATRPSDITIEGNGSTIYRSPGSPKFRFFFVGADSGANTGTTAYVSGCVPFDGDKNLVSKGKVPSQVSLEDAKKELARQQQKRLANQLPAAK